MKYKLFTELYKEAKEYSNVNMYIAERGWQEWMNYYDDPMEITKILNTIFRLSNSPLEESRKKIYSKRTEFARIYEYSNRTVQEWEYNKIKEGDKMIIDYTFFMEELLNENDKQ